MVTKNVFDESEEFVKLGTRVKPSDILVPFKSISYGDRVFCTIGSRNSHPHIMQTEYFAQ